MIRQFVQDVREMHWAPRLILALVIVKTLSVMIREAQIL